MPVYQILIALKQASPLDEITAISHQPRLESGEEFYSRQAILLLKSVEFGNDRRKTFLRINRLFQGCAKRGNLRRAAFFVFDFDLCYISVPRSDNISACEARKAAL